MPGNLYLIPAPLGDSDPRYVLSGEVFERINTIDQYVVENIRTARRFLKRMGIGTPISNLKFYELNNHTSEVELSSYLTIMKQNNTGLMSEAGVPGVADPGAALISLAHEHRIRVIPLVGPSSILLAMMASGLNGQNFSFHGYLPVKSTARCNKIKHVEKLSKKENQSQLFIETPYRNNQLLNDIMKTCAPLTQLCIAADLTLANEYIYTCSIEEWRKKKPDLHKRPAIFILHA